MTSSDSPQMTNGKAFEYALLLEFEKNLKEKTHVQIVNNSSFNVAKNCFEQITKIEQGQYLLYASFSVNFLTDLEPRLANDLGKNDILQLEILPDIRGEDGDVRDLLMIRSLQKWEIGVSAKNNHNAVKHSRLSQTIDFGQKWIGIGNSDTYFTEIEPIFSKLADIKEKSGGKKLWKDLGKYHESVYKPLLSAFSKELIRLYKKNGPHVTKNLMSYLLGKKDFYKVIKRKGAIQIYGYNLYGTLNLPYKEINPKHRTQKIIFPTEIISLKFKENSNNTLLLELNNDWLVSLRIHNASSTVEPSLKFDIKLLKAPTNLFDITIKIKN